MPLVPRPFLKISFFFIFFFWKFWKSWIFSWNWKFWLIFFFKQPKKYESNAPSPKAFFENFLLFFFFFGNFGNLEFFQGIENFDWWFFLKNLETLNFFKELKILIFFFFFERNLRSTSLMPLVPRPFLKIAFFENCLFFLKICSLSKKWRRWRWRWSKGDEDYLFMIFFFFFGKNLSFEWE